MIEVNACVNKHVSRSDDDGDTKAIIFARYQKYITDFISSGQVDRAHQSTSALIAPAPLMFSTLGSSRLSLLVLVCLFTSDNFAVFFTLRRNHLRP